MNGAEGKGLRVTSVERTLIDITVRPVYSGGASEVLNAYRLAKDKVSTRTLIGTLKEMNYVYPYHQAVGFYLERTGVYKKAELQQLRSMPMEHDFYLDYNMSETQFSEVWRIHFPTDL
ncbi:MAG: hypothetical protein LC803_23390 [Acidobacteria bacterium]|nr:hypothetical protein [Acidobacteriota bacterium]